MTRVAAIIPAHNEAARIADTVRAIQATHAFDDILVVDDGSDDSTAACAREAGARVMQLASNVGKGRALARGLTTVDADVVAFIDGDLGESASIAADLVAPVRDGAADMTIAAPPAGRRSGFGLVEGFAAAGIRRLGGARMARPLSGQRAMRRSLIEPERFAGRFGVEVGLTIDALRKGARVVEVPLGFTHAKTGKNWAGFTHRARQGADVAAALAVRAFRGRRRRA